MNLVKELLRFVRREEEPERGKIEGGGGKYTGEESNLIADGKGGEGERRKSGSRDNSGGTRPLLPASAWGSRSGKGSFESQEG